MYNYLSVQSTLKNERGTIVQNTNNWDLLKGLCGPTPWCVDFIKPYSELFLFLAEYCQEFLVLGKSEITIWSKMLQNSAWRFSPISTILALVSRSTTNTMSMIFLSINTLLTLTDAGKLMNIFEFKKWDRIQTWILCFSYSLQSVLGALPKPAQLEPIYVTLILFCLYSTFYLHSWVFFTSFAKSSLLNPFEPSFVKNLGLSMNLAKITQ